MANRYEVNLQEVEGIASKFSEYGAQAEQAVNSYFETEAFARITPHIQGYIHPSGRRFKGHTTSAASGSLNSVFRQDVSNLTLIIRSQTRYNYLYFPDDGSNTRHHQGNQHFMERGAAAVSSQIADEIVQRLVQQFEEA